MQLVPLSVPAVLVNILLLQETWINASEKTYGNICSRIKQYLEEMAIINEILKTKSVVHPCCPESIELLNKKEV